MIPSVTFWRSSRGSLLCPELESGFRHHNSYFLVEVHDGLQIPFVESTIENVNDMFRTAGNIFMFAMFSPRNAIHVLTWLDYTRAFAVVTNESL